MDTVQLYPQAQQTNWQKNTISTFHNFRLAVINFTIH